ncbi:hypothetical protein C0J52_09248, partial [Blattella germanica]
VSDVRYKRDYQCVPLLSVFSDSFLESDFNIEINNNSQEARWLFGAQCCQFFAFLHHFFGMSQISTVTMLTVERVIVVRQLYSGGFLSLRLYIIGIISCWSASIVWAMPPLLGWGRYTCDPTAMSCSLDWTSKPNQSEFGYNMALLIIGGVIPVIVTCLCVWHSVNGEGKYSSSSSDLDINRAAQRALTKASALVPILACIACDFNMRRALLGILRRPTFRQKRRKPVQLKDIK